MQAVEEFRQTIERAGLTVPEMIHADGKLHRFASNGDRADDAGWYLFFPDGVPAGAFGCWRTGLKQTWCEKSDRQMSEQERIENRRRLDAARRQREAEERHRHAVAAARAQTIWDEATPVDASHPYLREKHCRPHGLRVDTDGQLLVPVLIRNAITSLQFIAPTGDKKFLHGGEVRGGSFALGDLADANTVLLCEGYATAASLYEATCFPVVMAFSAGNLTPVAEQVRQQLPTAVIVLAADNDLRTDEKPNVGLAAATAAAQAVGGLLALPDLDGEKSDFNDLHIRRGLEAVGEVIRAVLKQPVSLLDDVYTFLGRFVAYPSEHAQRAHTLWITHTHLMDKWESTPRIAFLSPEPGSGKTRALEVTASLVPRPMESMNATAAALFRTVSDPDGAPTILFDEIDTIFGPKARDHEDIRALINAGHRRGAVAHRCAVKGKQIVLEKFPAYCAVALAGLGHLPDTILTRSIVIRMRRRAPSEYVELYRHGRQAVEGHHLRDRLAAWALQIEPFLLVDPAMPPGITDRDAHVWESLLSIADAAGGEWPDRARVSAVTLVTDTKRDRGSLGIRLLADLRTVFGEKIAMATIDIVEALINLEESPWGDLRGKPIDGRRLSKLLKPYEIAPKPVRFGANVFKGYERTDLHDAWVRYLPSEAESPLGLSPIASVTSVTNDTNEPRQLGIEEECSA